MLDMITPTRKETRHEFQRLLAGDRRRGHLGLRQLAEVIGMAIVEVAQMFGETR